MADTGQPSSVSDAAVGALCARSAVIGAFYNVRINCPDLKDRAVAEDFLSRGRDIEKRAIEVEREILSLVDGKLQP